HRQPIRICSSNLWWGFRLERIRMLKNCYEIDRTTRDCEVLWIIILELVGVTDCRIAEFFVRICPIGNYPKLLAGQLRYPTGKIVAYGEGGTPPYSYSWSNGATTSTATELLPGSYTVTVS